MNDWVTTNPSWPSINNKPLSPSNPWDALSQDELLILWESKKKALSDAKDAEMELRKYIVDRAFPEKQEGTNTLELGNGYQLKAGVKFNYKLSDVDNETIEKCLDRISKIGNEGSFIAERLISWKPSFLLTEYRTLLENESETAKKILAEVNTILTIEDAAPTLTIKEPKVKK